mmetsp:Transcript_38111/g.109002  ORF Transcript_38111/g.109002 Transcript_38111/m.109002 type:complete len:368 (+) Transcript_38111:705-1808(+)
MLEVSDEGREVRLLEFVREENVVLHEAFCSVVLGAHLHLDRPPQGGPLELGHLGRHRGGEEERVPLARDDLQNLVQGLVEVHRQETVRLVHHDVFDGLQVESLRVLQVVYQPPWRRDDHVRPLRQRHGLRDHVQTAHDHGCLELDAAADGLELLADLHAELSRGRHHNGKEALRGVQEALNDGQREGARLATARLGEADHVPPLQGPRDRLHLYGGGRMPLQELAGTAQLLAHAQVCEGLRRTRVCWPGGVLTDGRRPRASDGRGATELSVPGGGWGGARRRSAVLPSPLLLLAPLLLLSLLGFLGGFLGPSAGSGHGVASVCGHRPPLDLLLLGPRRRVQRGHLAHFAARPLTPGRGARRTAAART